MSNNSETSRLPAQYRPISPWTYWGLGILYSLPILGTIFLIIHSISAKNINRRNYARSYWIPLILSLIAVGVFLILVYSGAIGTAFLEKIQSLK